MHQDKRDQRTADAFREDPAMERLEELVEKNGEFKPTPAQRIALGFYRQTRDVAKRLTGGDAA